MKNKVSEIIMIRPVMFGFNEQTESTNSFQQNDSKLKPAEIQRQALKEFDEFVSKLRENNIQVNVIEDTLIPRTPDSIYPNNWISFHENNTIVLYPMMAENRRDERRNDIVEQFKNKNTTLIDLSFYENENIFLEGTGSIVFDYENKIAYANSSPRTNAALLEKLCKQLNYSIILFEAKDLQGEDIYHTNVVMCIGNGFAVICEDCVKNKKDLENVLNSLQETNHELVFIDYSQMNSFAGNMYQLFNADGESFIVMSKQAFDSLNENQKNKLNTFGTLLYSNLSVIEKYGGGSARCMMGDVISNFRK